MRAFSVLVVSVLALSLFASSAASFTGITPDLRSVLDRAGPEEKIRVNIMMDRTADYERFIKEAQGLTRRERRAQAVALMTRVADQTQSEVRAFLAEQELSGNVSGILVLLGVNGINVWATRDVIEQVARFEGVRSVDWDEEIPDELVLDLVAKPDNLFFPLASDTSWGVKKINAPLVWDLSITGAGVLVGIIDTGVNYNHVDLAGHMWDGGPAYPNHGWDFRSGDNDPMDTDGHGTACAGIVAGDGTAGLQTGVAPDATVMALRAGGNESAMWAASDFAIVNGCDVISSSMSWKYPSNPDYVGWRDQAVAEWAAGVIRANSIGNQGNQPGSYPIPYNIATPGNCPPPWLHPDQTLVGDISSTMGCGAVDQSDVILDYSGRGPSAWERGDFPPYYQDYPYNNGIEMGLLKPDVCAPTEVRTLSHTNTSGYITGFGGTSAATPHLGGAMCLVLSADTTITPEAVSQKIQMNTVDLGLPGKDNVYGAGRIDVFAAITSNLYTMVTVQDYAISDTVVGDGDGRLEVGETADLVISLRASGAWADADSVSAVLRTGDPDITVLDSTSYVGFISKGSVVDNSLDPFRLSFPSGAAHWTELSFHVTSVPPNFSDDDTVSLLIGQPDIILVDDDAGQPYENYYRQTLNNLGRVYDEWEVETQGTVPASGPYSLGDHEVTIWFTGDDTMSAVLTDTDTTRIAEFLDNGGKLFITSQNLGQALSTTPFYQERLHASFLTENVDNNLCTGVPGDDIGDGLRLVLQGSGGAGNAYSEDRISPNPGADSCFYYTTYGGASGIKYDSGVYKLVYFGFPFESIHGVSIYADQDTVMARILKWLWSTPGVNESFIAPARLEFGLRRMAPNPFRTSVEISYSLSASAEIDLSVYDASGRLVKSLASGLAEPGLYSTRWDGLNDSGDRLPAGVYFSRLESGDRAVTRKVTLIR
jgi:subtilisin family serine protease